MVNSMTETNGYSKKHVRNAKKRVQCKLDWITSACQ